MANRRMFSLNVVDTDKFLDMPATSQNLYFHLGMRADDDGFVSSPRKITKLVNCSKDDLEVLLAREFIIAVDDGVVVIRHWKQNNYIQKDRYNRTIYQKQLDSLTVNNGVYCLDTERIQNVSQMEAQVRLGKSKDSINKHYCVEFDLFWKVYPRKKEKGKAYKAYMARLKDGYSEDELRQAATKYAAECKQRGTEERYIKLGSTFLSASTPFEDYLRGGTAIDGNRSMQMPVFVGDL